MKLELTPDARRALRAQAHHLDPVVMIGNDGLTPAVLHEIDISLKSHGLIKIRVFSDDRQAREAMLEQIAGDMDAAAVQHIGKLLVLYRPPVEEEPDTTEVPARKRASRPVASKPGARQREYEAARRRPPRGAPQPRSISGDARRRPEAPAPRDDARTAPRAGGRDSRGDGRTDARADARGDGRGNARGDARGSARGDARGDQSRRRRPPAPPKGRGR